MNKSAAMVKDLDPANDLTFLRIRSKKCEIMVAPRKRSLVDFNWLFACVYWNCSISERDLLLIVIQKAVSDFAVVKNVKGEI